MCNIVQCPFYCVHVTQISTKYTNVLLTTIFVISNSLNSKLFMYGIYNQHLYIYDNVFQIFIIYFYIFIYREFWISLDLLFWIWF